MLIKVLQGSCVDNAENRGAMYFEALPACGDEIEIENQAYLVVRAWHTPSIFYAGPKAAILIHAPHPNLAFPAEEMARG